VPAAEFCLGFRCARTTLYLDGKVVGRLARFQLGYCIALFPVAQEFGMCRRVEFGVPYI
jgi:hypothetical protein